MTSTGTGLGARTRCRSPFAVGGRPQLEVEDTTRAARQHVHDAAAGQMGVGSAERFRPVGITVRRTQHQDGIIRVLLDRSGMRGPQWDEVIDAYDYRFRPLRMLYSPCGRDAFYFCLMAPAGSERAGLPVDVAMWSVSFPMFAPGIARIGDDGRYDRYATTSLSRWSTGRVAVVGDAAHVMPSSLGQGAGVSMLNALALVRAATAEGDVPSALAGWEAQTRPIVEAWQRRAEQVAADRYLTGPRHPGADFEAEKPAATPPMPGWLVREGQTA